MATKTKNRKAAPVVEDEDEELDDLDELDELEDFDEDDESEDEDDEEEETPKARNDKKTAKVKASRKASKVTSTPGKQKASATKNRPEKAKSNGNTPPARRVAEGMKGAASIATDLGIEARAVRIALRKLNINKSDTGLYEWKGREYDQVVKKVKSEVSGK